MQKYKKIKKLRQAEFKRLTGIQPATFQEMVFLLKEAEVKRRSHGGKPHRLKIEDRLDLLRNLSLFKSIFSIINSCNQIKTEAKPLTSIPVSIA